MNKLTKSMEEFYSNQVQKKLQRVLQNEKMFCPPCADALPRIIVIDGCNIARGSCGPHREYINCAGLLAAIRYFLIRDIDVTVFMPVIYLNNENSSVSDSHLLMELRKFDIITFTPARASHRGRPAFLNYDDLYVLHAAKRFGGIVVSNDRYSDIMKHDQYIQYHDIIANRRLDIQFIPVGKSIVKFGKDIFYKCLPNIDFSTSTQTSIFRKKSLYCMPFDEDYEKVVFRGRHWTKSRRLEIIRVIDALLLNMENSCSVYDFTSCISTFNPLLSIQFGNVFQNLNTTKFNQFAKPFNVNEYGYKYQNSYIASSNIFSYQMNVMAFKKLFDNYSKEIKKEETKMVQSNDDSSYIEKNCIEDIYDESSKCNIKNKVRLYKSDYNKKA
uniref:RNase_Zc3h12a domain-containing protein n=1 Tax=Parastrongyloides trichosuri TaxID=131310 RepID=A0A0N4ZH85_PARTI